jgi:Haem-binding domain
MRIRIGRAAFWLLVLLAAAQLVPYGRDHSNPSMISEPPWDSMRTRDLARIACYDCHSNETRWPWYSHVAPFSWIVQRDVERGRAAFNFSEWHRISGAAVDGMPSLGKGSMPPGPYRRTHGLARLTLEERKELCAGLVRTLSGLIEFQARADDRETELRVARR